MTPDARILRGGLCLADAQRVARAPCLEWSDYQRAAAEKALDDAVAVFGLADREAALAYPCEQLAPGYAVGPAGGGS